MKRFTLSVIILALTLFAFSVPAEGQLWPGSASRVLTRPTLPATCEPRNGQIIYLQTSNRGVYSCTETNVWTRIDTSGTFNVKAFGALGNGIADDTAEIQAALTAAGLVHGRVFVPFGTYIFSSVLTVPADIIFQGVGSGSVLRTNLNNHRGMDVGSRTRVCDMVVEGANLGVAAGSMGINSGGTDLVRIERCTVRYWGTVGILSGGAPTNWLVRDNEVYLNFNEGIYIGPGGSNNIVEGNRIHDNRNNGIDCASNSTIIRNNILTHNGTAAGADCYGILVYCNVAWTPQVDIVIADNLVRTSHEAGIQITAGAGALLSRINITGNISVLNDGSGLDLESANNAEDITVTGNTFSSNVGSGISLTQMTRVLMVGNTMALNGVDGIQFNQPALECDNNVVSGNIIRNNVNHGITLVAGDDNMIVNNLVTANGVADMWVAGLRTVVAGNSDASLGAFVIGNLPAPAYAIPLTLPVVAHAVLVTMASPNGSMIYCTDCTLASPCAAAGPGALAKRITGAWVCN